MIIYQGKSYWGLASFEGSSVLQAMPEVTVAMLWTVLICYIEQVSEAPLPEFHGVSYLAAFMLTMRTGIAYKRYTLGAESLNEMECESRGPLGCSLLPPAPAPIAKPLANPLPRRPPACSPRHDTAPPRLDSRSDGPHAACVSRAAHAVDRASQTGAPPPAARRRFFDDDRELCEVSRQRRNVQRGRHRRHVAPRQVLRAAEGRRVRRDQQDRPRHLHHALHEPEDIQAAQ
mmetsp:Transcript_95019/g.271687  ORF Transcript_95019/g.271687 Transcript_95019/m.271687 type:complete len:231 (-) Transcript_95019:1449-2141(-)